MDGTKNILERKLEKEWIFWKTDNGHVYPIELYADELSRDEIIIDTKLTNEFCRGCSNYGTGGGCPPYVPSADKVLGNYTNFYMIGLRFHYQYASEKQLIPRTWLYLVTFFDRTISRIAENLGSTLQRRCEGSFLSTGNCRSCGSKKCSFNLGFRACVNPTKRRYSSESLGIRLDQIMMQTYDEPLYWFRSGVKRYPPHQDKIIMLMMHKSPFKIFSQEGLRGFVRDVFYDLYSCGSFGLSQSEILKINNDKSSLLEHDPKKCAPFIINDFHMRPVEDPITKDLAEFSQGVNDNGIDWLSKRMADTQVARQLMSRLKRIIEKNMSYDDLPLSDHVLTKQAYDLYRSVTVT